MTKKTKTLILGDIHGRSVWKELVSSEKPNKVIFLGDYVTSRERIPESEQISNLIEILDFKEDASTGIEVILLRGNHDVQALDYWWATCAPVFSHTEYFTDNGEALKNRFLKLTQWVYLDGDILYSHAGVTKSWFNAHKHKFGSIEGINNVGPCESFSFQPGTDNPWDVYGDSKFQSCLWVRPGALVKDALFYTQVVGHTTMGQCGYQIIHNETGDTREVWFCDCLPHSYLVLEGNKFRVANRLTDQGTPQ